jgi:hypothetical protein
MFVNRFGSHIKTMKIILNTRDSSSGSLQRHGGQGVFNLGIVTFLRLILLADESKFSIDDALWGYGTCLCPRRYGDPRDAIEPIIVIRSEN